MANDEHVALLKQGVDAWNKWRDENPRVRVDVSGEDLREAFLSGADLTEADLRKAFLADADLSGVKVAGALAGLEANLREAGAHQRRLSSANLTRANLGAAALSGANLLRANLTGANLTGANLTGAKLDAADLCEANLTRANLTGASLFGADLYKADLSGADLRSATLVSANLCCADLTGCRIHGVSAWDLRLEGAKQQNLVITRADEPEITVDNIEVAQFIYLMLNNQKVRDVIDTITSKMVLILGRFTDERKVVLDALREELRKRDYLPILFDFELPERRNVTETVTLLARMARFIIADLTDPSSIPQELQAIIPFRSGACSTAAARRFVALFYVQGLRPAGFPLGASGVPIQGA